MSAPIDEDAVAAADKEMEERANRAKELLSQRYRGLKTHQVRKSIRVLAVYGATAKKLPAFIRFSRL